MAPHDQALFWRADAKVKACADCLDRSKPHRNSACDQCAGYREHSDHTQHVDRRQGLFLAMGKGRG